MTIVQLSNLFNLISENMPDIGSYHYGWPSDMNLNIQNNYDPNASTGTKFPAVLFMPPTLSTRTDDSNTEALFSRYGVELLFTDTYGYNAQTLGYKSDTTVECEAKLQTIAADFINYLRAYAFASETSFNIGDYTVEFDPWRFVQKTRSIRIRFELVFPGICPDDDLNLDFLPASFEDLETTDYEKPEIPS